MTNSVPLESLALQLAELEEQISAGAARAGGDATVANLKAELDTFVAELRRSPPENEFANESACQKVTEMVKAIGYDPDDLTGWTIDRAGDTGKPSATAETTLGMLGIYELMTKLGEGGMGAVYKARHTKLDKIVAIKVLPTERMKDKGAVARFEREMRAVGKLEHPNIVRAMDAGEAGGMHYLVMEYVQGVDLSQLAKGRQLSIADACELIRQAAVGLEEARDNGMVHRDIKPSNLMLCVVGKKKPPVVKILDMGLALLSEAHSADAQGLTTTGQMMGTLDYMAPEQGGDSKNVDIRADIYALGASLYKLLCGEAIYYGPQYQTPVQKMMALATQPATPIQKRRKGVSNELAVVLHRMLEKNPDKRTATPDEVAQALAPFCAGANLAALLNSVGFDVAPTPDTSQSKTQASFSQPDADTGVSQAPLKVAKPLGATGGSPTSAAAAKAKPPISSPEKTNPALAKAPAPKSPPAPARVDQPPVPQAAISLAPVPHIHAKPTPAKTLAKTSAARKLPPWLPIAIGGGLLGFGGIVALAAAMVFYFQTPNGTLRVEINDPSIEVTVKGTDIVIKQADKDEIILTPGEHALVVKRGDFTFDTRNFELKKGETTTVKVDLLPGKVQVALADGAILCEKAMGTPLATVEPKLPTPGTGSIEPVAANVTPRSGGNNVLQLDGKEGNLAQARFAYDPEQPLTLEGYFKVNTTKVDEVNGLLATLPQVQLQIAHSSYAVGGQGVIAGEQRFKSGEWVHLAGVAADKEMRLFVDGKRVATVPITADKKVKQQAPLLLCVGIASELDEVRVSQAARYDADFTPAKRFEPDNKTLALYHCDETEGDVLHDSSGKGHDATTTGGMWVARNATNFNDQAAVARWLLENKKIANIGFEIDGEVQNLPSIPPGTVKVRDLNFHLANNGGNLLEQDIPRLAVFTDLEWLNLGRQPLTDAGLASLAPLKKLKWLCVADTSLTPAAVKTIREFPQLELLHSFETDAWLQPLAGAPSIRTLHFYRQAISPQAVEWFQQYPNVTELRFIECGADWTNEKLAPLKDCKQLAKLELSYTTIDDTSVEFFGSLKGLVELNVTETKLTEAGLKKIAAALPACKITWTGGVIEPTVSQATVARWLLENKKLTLIGFEVDDQVQHLGAVPTGPCKVRELNFNPSNNGGKLLVEDLPRLAVFTDLERLEIAHLPMTDAHLASLAPLKKLKGLALYATELTPASAKTIREFPQLESLQGLSDDESLRTLAGMPSIKSLTFYRSAVSPEAIAWFKQYPNLTRLEIVESGKHTPESLAVLKECPRLSRLVLGDEGYDDRFVDAISGVQGLTELDVNYSKITAAGVKKIATALPACKITWSGGVIEPTVKTPDSSSLEQRAALQFAGVKSYVELPLKLADAKCPLTIETWILNEDKELRINLKVGDDSMHLMRMEGKWHWLTLQADDQAPGIVGEADQTAGAYSHVAAVNDAGTLKLFIDGQPVAGKRQRRTMPNVSKLPSFIGYALPTDFGTHKPGGTITSVRISKSARYRDPFTPAQQLATDADTLALYACDEGEGNVLRDSSGNNHHGKIAGAKWVNFDALDAAPAAVDLELILLADKAMDIPGLAVEHNEPITLEGFFTPAPRQAKKTASMLGGPWHGLCIEPKGHWQFGWTTDAFHAVGWTEVVPGRRTHVAGVRTADELLLFVDGKLSAREKPAAGAKANMQLGFGGDFAGRMDELRISSIARYTQDFAPLAPGARLTPDEHTLALYHCDEGSGDTLRDASVNKRDVKLTGAQWVVRDIPPAAGGEVVDLLAAMDPAAMNSELMTWKRDGERLAGVGVGPAGEAKWWGVIFPEVLTGDFDIEVEVLQSGLFPLQYDVPLGDASLRFSLAPDKCEMFGFDKKDGTPPLPTPNAYVKMKSNSWQKIEVRVRHRGPDVDVTVVFDGHSLGTYSGERSRVKLPHWVKPDVSHFRCSGMGDYSKVKLEYRNAIVRKLPTSDNTVANGARE